MGHGFGFLNYSLGEHKMAHKQSQKRYLIYNATRMEPKFCPKTGEDLRTTRQRVGHAVSIRDRNDDVKLIPAGGRPALVDEITPGMLALASPDEYGNVHIRIKEVDDVMEALKDHVMPAKAAPVRQQAFPGGVPPNSPTPAPVARQAKAVEMGKDTHTQAGGSEHEGAINPDGNPNFLVRAKAGEHHGKRNRKKDGAVALEG